VLDPCLAFSRRSAVWWTGLLLGLLLTAGFFVGIVVGIWSAVTQLAHGTPPAWLDAKSPVFAAVINSVAFASVLLIAHRRLHFRWRSFFAIRGAPPLAFAALCVAMSGFLIVISDCGNVCQRLVPMPDFLRGLFESLGNLERYPVLSPLLLVVVAPVTEELFFRGFVLRGLLPKTTPGRAVWTSALLFMGFHLNPWQFPVTLMLGLLLGWIYVRTRSLVLCTAAHAFNNAGVLLAAGLPFTVRGFNSGEGYGRVLQPIWFDVLGLLLAALGIWLLRRTTKPFQDEAISATTLLSPALTPAAPEP
jgi:membrane protease YdiL (CAAX protease family)